VLVKDRTTTLVSGSYKTCSNCGEIKPLSMFYKRTDRKSGYTSHCKDCILEKREAYRLSKGIQPYYENKDCSMYFGVLAEDILENYFKNVTRMPSCNPGFDYICGRGFKIDVKASTRHNRNSGDLEGWQFEVRHNAVADYFLCIAFDSRESLNPEHIWLIPGKAINHLRFTSISETTLAKWSQWERPIGKVLECCNVLKEIQDASY
jgi:hypothetical protein